MGTKLSIEGQLATMRRFLNIKMLALCFLKQSKIYDNVMQRNVA